MNINLNDLNFENLGQWPLPVKIGAIVMLSFVILFAGYFYVISESINQYNTLQTEEENLRTEFEYKEHQASNLQAYRNQMVVMEEKFGNMLKKLPGKNEMPGLLEDISKTGVGSGLVFELFAPEAEVEHDFYIEVPIKIAVIANYHQFATFLSRVAQMSRIVTVHDFVIDDDISDLKNSSSNKNKDDLLEMKLTAKIYRYRTK